MHHLPARDVLFILESVLSASGGRCQQSSSVLRRVVAPDLVIAEGSRYLCTNSMRACAAQHVWSATVAMAIKLLIFMFLRLHQMDLCRRSASVRRSCPACHNLSNGPPLVPVVGPDRSLLAVYDCMLINRSHFRTQHERKSCPTRRGDAGSIINK